MKLLKNLALVAVVTVASSGSAYAICDETCSVWNYEEVVNCMKSAKNEKACQGCMGFQVKCCDIFDACHKLFGASTESSKD